MAKMNAAVAVEVKAALNSAEPSKITFSKAKILTFQRYAPRRDLLGAILNDGRTYTVDEVDAAIDTFMKGKVK